MRAHYTGEKDEETLGSGEQRLPTIVWSSRLLLLRPGGNCAGRQCKHPLCQGCNVLTALSPRCQSIISFPAEKHRWGGGGG